MLSVRAVDISYGDLKAVRGVSLDVEADQIVSLVGSNGAGKTTLMRAVSGLKRVSSGSITLEGTRIDGLGPHQIVDLGIIHVPEGRLLFPEMTVIENLEMGSYTARARKGSVESIREVMKLFPVLDPRRAQLAGTLSGGEQQMLAIGRGLMAQPKLLMLDEPSLGLAPIVVEEIFNVVQTIKDGGTPILLVEQNVFHALSISDAAYVIENGRIVMDGRGSEIMNDERIKEAYLGL
jgi:branched-chain amino acid transport system ATP-binding protein